VKSANRQERRKIKLSDAKRIAKNIALITGGGVFRAVLMPLFTIFIARELGTEGFGAFSFALSLASILVIVGEMGLPKMVVRELANHREDVARYIGDLTVLRLVSGLASMGIVALILVLTPRASDTRIPLFLIGLSLLVFTGLRRFFDAIFQAFEVMKYQALVDMREMAIPRRHLLDRQMYSVLNTIQATRGCPFDCDFCDITVLYGRKPRTKTKTQVIAELDALYFTGWRGPVFFVDDNFIGNKSKLKKEILPAIVEWNEKRKNPFYFNTEVSINLADDDNLMQLMVKAGFEAVFIGIESPNEESLVECNKIQNRNRDLIESVKKIQLAGLEVQGGFIVGFDNDPPIIFDKLTNFIQESGIVTAMVGLLNAPRGTKLQKRLLKEGRLLNDFTGNNTDFSINFIPHMDSEELINGYKKILHTIYSPKYYYARVMRFMKDFEPKKKKVFHLNPNYILALFRSIIKLEIGRASCRERV